VVSRAQAGAGPPFILREMATMNASRGLDSPIEEDDAAAPSVLDQEAFLFRLISCRYLSLGSPVRPLIPFRGNHHKWMTAAAVNGRESTAYAQLRPTLPDRATTTAVTTITFKSRRHLGTCSSKCPKTMFPKANIVITTATSNHSESICHMLGTPSVSIRAATGFL
jgi:hypothetical protein